MTVNELYEKVCEAKSLGLEHLDIVIDVDNKLWVNTIDSIKVDASGSRFVFEIDTNKGIEYESRQ